MYSHARLFADVAVIVRFHPRAKALRFWRDAAGATMHSAVVYDDTPLRPKEELEADIAQIATALARAALPDFHAFCVDVETLFHGSQPSGPIADIHDLDWYTLRRISAYAQYWRSRNAREVNKLLAFLMGLPLFAQLVGLFISRSDSHTWRQIRRQTEAGGVFFLGVGRFDELFRRELDHALNEARVLVSTYQGAKVQGGARIVNTMAQVVVERL